MIVKHKFSVEYTVDKPVCNSCKGDFELDSKSSKENPSWDVEEYFYVDGKKIELHKKCLKKLASSILK